MEQTLRQSELLEGLEQNLTERLLGIAQHQTLREFAGKSIAPDDFADPTCRTLFQHLVAAGTTEAATLLNTLSTEDQESLRLLARIEAGEDITIGSTASSPRPLPRGSVPAAGLPSIRKTVCFGAQPVRLKRRVAISG